MVKRSKCVVPFCGNEQQHNKECIYAKFPKDIERCRTWVKVVGYEDLLYLLPQTLNSIRYVCGYHFNADQFTDATRKHLKRSAIPSIFDPKIIPLGDDVMASFPLKTDYQRVGIGDCTKKPTAQAGALSNAVNTTPNSVARMHIPMHAEDTRRWQKIDAATNQDEERILDKQSKLKLRRYRPSVAVQRTTKKKLTELGFTGSVNATPRETKLLKHIQKQTAEFRAKLDDLRNVNDRIIKLSSHKEYVALTQDISSPALRQIVLANIKNGKKPCQGRRWSLEEKLIALSIYKRGPKAYSYLQHIIALPSTRTLLRIVRKIPMGTGISKLILKHLKKAVTKMPATNKECNRYVKNSHYRSIVTFAKRKIASSNFVYK